MSPRRIRAGNYTSEPGVISDLEAAFGRGSSWRSLKENVRNEWFYHWELYNII